MALPEGFEPIETAPKDGTRILLMLPYAAVPFACGRWDADQYAAKPRPYWRSDLALLYGMRWTRENQPIAWKPLP